MNHMPLLQHLKTLKAAMPQANKQVKIQSKLPIFKNIKDITKKSGQMNQGIFFNLSFCIPYIDPINDPTPQKLTQIVRGIFMQGGLIIEFNKKMNQQHVKFVIISEKSRIDEIKKQLDGLVKFDKILKYQFVLDSLKRLKLMDSNKYLLQVNEFNIKNQSKKIQIAKQKLQAEKIHNNLIRPKLPELPEQDKKNEYKQTDQRKNNNYDITIDKNETFIQQKIQIQQQSKKQNNFDGDQVQSNQKNAKNITAQNNSTTQSKISGLVSPFHKQPLSNKNRSKKLDQKSVIQQKSFQTQKKTVLEEPPQFKWENKRDRRIVWFEPPKNLSSHNFKNNNFICDKFMELQQIYKRNGDIRSFSYIKAVAIIKSYDKQIKTAQDLKLIKGLSNGLIQKAKELLQTGSLGKLTKQKSYCLYGCMFLLIKAPQNRYKTISNRTISICINVFYRKRSFQQTNENKSSQQRLTTI